MGRERGTEAVAQLLSELAQSDEMRALPAFAVDRRAATAPRAVRRGLAVLRDEIEPHVARTVAFFLAACRHGGGD
jgi:hypothetical protein